jgi:hypothetical protein
MPKTRPPYSPQLRARLIELARSGRSPEDWAGSSSRPPRRFATGSSRPIAMRPSSGRPDHRGAGGSAAPAPGSAGPPRRAGHPPRSRGLVRPGDQLAPIPGCEFVRAHQGTHRVATVCRVLGVSASGCHAWQSRPLSARAHSDRARLEQIRTIHDRSRGTYGAPRIHAEPAADGVHSGRKRVARLMQAAGLAGVSRRAFVTTTRRDPAARPAPDLVQWTFTVTRPDHLWVAAITDIATWAGVPLPGGRAGRLESSNHRMGHGSAFPDGAGRDALNMAIGQRHPTQVIHIPIKGASTPLSPSDSGAARLASGRRWDPWATPMTTPSARASSPPSSASSSTGGASRPRSRPASPSSSPSKVVQPAPSPFRPGLRVPDQP